MKREVAAEIVDSLKEAGVDFVATLTEANLHDLVIALGEDSAIHHVPVTREEEASASAPAPTWAENGPRW
jgi:sulfopyruvate decarboxylase TPP-binding subunit